MCSSGHSLQLEVHSGIACSESMASLDALQIVPRLLLPLTLGGMRLLQSLFSFACTNLLMLLEGSGGLAQLQQCSCCISLIIWTSRQLSVHWRHQGSCVLLSIGILACTTEKHTHLDVGFVRCQQQNSKHFKFSAHSILHNFV